MPTPSPARLAADLEGALRAAANPARAEQERRYLKSSLVHLGASVPGCRRAVADLLRAHPALDRPRLVALVPILWARGVFECRFAAVELLEQRLDLLRAADLAGVVEPLLRDAHTWALVDGLAASVAGPLVERFPRLGRVVERWARDEDFWIRRSALLAEYLALRGGRGDFERFARHADAMLEEEEFFIRKAIGWVLRDVAKKAPDRVARWLLPRAARASGLTVREATKYLPAGSRREILEARKGTGRGSRSGSGSGSGSRSGAGSGSK
jgi:3-methyladenine DNA glycosylase AlkD